MRIGIDAYLASALHRSLGGYTVELVAQLRDLGLDEVIALAPDWWYEDGMSASQAATHGIQLVPARRSARESYFSLRERWEQDIFPRTLLAYDIDVLFGPAFVIPVTWPGSTVVAIHDLAFERSAQYNSPESNSFYSRWARSSAERASAIVAPSRFTYSDIALFWRLGDKTAVVPAAPLLSFIPRDRETSRQSVMQGLGISHRYVLYVGNSFPRKNLPRLLRAFALIGGEAPGVQLVLTVTPTEGIWRVIVETGLEDRVRMIGHCEPALLPHLYAASEVLVYPSLMEGFGMPPLEAMLCSTAVAASRIPAHREVLQEAALYFDPFSTHEIASVLLAVLSDDNLRQSLAQAGLRHASRYSWDATAKRTREVLATAVRQHRVSR